MVVVVVVVVVPQLTLGMLEVGQREVAKIQKGVLEMGRLVWQPWEE
jgi:hypothetical protein